APAHQFEFIKPDLTGFYRGHDAQTIRGISPGRDVYNIRLKNLSGRGASSIWVVYKENFDVAIVRLQHIGIAVPDLRAACDCFEQLYGLTARDYRNDQGRGMQLDARIVLGNACWLHVVQNWNPESRVYQFLDKQGPGLEHIALQTDNI